MGTRLDNAKALYLEGIRDGHPREAVAKYTGARYTQHSTGVKDGQEGFIEFFEDFIERCPVRDIQIVRGWEDGQYVFVHAFQNINNGEAKWVTTDFFDTDEEGRIIEHWDVIAKFGESTPSGHTTTDGATEITDLDKTEQNKALVKDMIENLLMRGGDTSDPGKWIAERYIQHNVDVPDGLEPFAKLAQDPNRPLNYDKIHIITGSGNFVSTLCEAHWEDQRYCQADIFRVENGKIVEHWDCAEPCPPDDQLANSGKF